MKADKLPTLKVGDKRYLLLDGEITEVEITDVDERRYVTLYDESGQPCMNYAVGKTLTAYHQSLRNALHAKADDPGDPTPSPREDRRYYYLARTVVGREPIRRPVSGPETHKTLEAAETNRDKLIEAKAAAPVIEQG